MSTVSPAPVLFAATTRGFLSWSAGPNEARQRSMRAGLDPVPGVVRAPWGQLPEDFPPQRWLGGKRGGSWRMQGVGERDRGAAECGRWLSDKTVHQPGVWFHKS